MIVLFISSYIIIRSKIGYPESISESVFLEKFIGYLSNILIISGLVCFICLGIVLVNELKDRNYLALFGKIDNIKNPFIIIFITIIIMELLLFIFKLLF